MFQVQTKLAVKTPEWLECKKEALFFDGDSISADISKVGDEAVIAGCPVVKKWCEFDGKRWAWVGIGNVRIKVWEGSDACSLLNLNWVTKTVTKTFVAVKGTLKTLGDKQVTVENARIMRALLVCCDTEADVEKVVKGAEGLEID